MASTTNYSWSTPDDTALVKDGAAAIRSLGSAIDSTVFTNAGAAINKTIVDAKGDLIAATAADTVSRLAVGTNGQVLTADSTAATGIKWATASSGVTTWTQRTNPASNTAAYFISNNGSLWVQVGPAGFIRTSSDGITWTSRTSGTAEPLYCVRYANSLWVAVGGNGTIITSSDGITWTSRTSGFGSNNIYNVKYLNSLWLAVGDGSVAGTGGISTSTDGLTWTLRTTTAAASNLGTISDVNYGNGYYLAVGQANSSNTGLYSTNGTSWTYINTGADAYGVYYDGTNWITVGNSTLPTRYAVSNPTGSWLNWNNTFSLQLMPVTAAHAILTEYNNTMYAIGTSGNTLNPKLLLNWSKGSTGLFTTTFYSPIGNMPAIPSSANASTINLYSFAISTTGQIAIGDNAGRIWTNF